MKTKENRLKKVLTRSLVALVLTFGFLGMEGCSSGNNRKFEYKIEYIDDLTSQEDLNELGKERWEIVGSRRATSSGDYGYELILMRDLQ